MKGLAKEIGGSITVSGTDGVKIIIIFERDVLHHMNQLQDDYLESA
jgi:hypothetical protein